MRHLRRVILPFILAIALAVPASAEKRVALVIGNSAYKHAPALANPKNDAEGIAAALARLNFEVLAGTDLDKAGMQPSPSCKRNGNSPPGAGSATRKPIVSGARSWTNG